MYILGFAQTMEITPPFAFTLGASGAERVVTVTLQEERVVTVTLQGEW